MHEIGEQVGGVRKEEQPCGRPKDARHRLASRDRSLCQQGKAPGQGGKEDIPQHEGIGEMLRVHHAGSDKTNRAADRGGDQRPFTSSDHSRIR